MKVTTFRISKKQVDRQVVMGLLSQLQGLQERYPIAFLDFVAVARKRETVIMQSSVELLQQFGLLNDSRRPCAHDVWREVIAECVAGDGLMTHVINPFSEEETTVQDVRTLNDGLQTKVDASMVTFLNQHLRTIHLEDPTALPELLRMITQQRRSSFGRSMETLKSNSLLEIVEDRQPIAILTSVGMLEAELVGQGYLKIPKAVQQLLPVILRGHEKGLPIFHLPFADERATPATPKSTAVNGHAQSAIDPKKKLGKKARRRLRRQAAATAAPKKS